MILIVTRFLVVTICLYTPARGAGALSGAGPREENPRVSGLEPAPLMLPNPPPPRDRVEFEAALRAIPEPDGSVTGLSKPLHIVLCAAEKDQAHLRTGLHDYPLWRDRWVHLLGLSPGIVIEPADRWPTADQWQRADVVVSYHNNPAWDAAKGADLDAFLTRGGGLVFLHFSINAFVDRPELGRRTGLYTGDKKGKVRYGKTSLHFLPHEVTAGFPMDRTVAFADETYSELSGSLEGWSVLATSAEPGGAAPQVWSRESGRGRVFVCLPGHSTWTHDDPLYRLLVFRGILWSARQPLGRFNELTTVGARLGP
ncbi:MAG: ThuA domain-containing protein [Opitutaceae bacterium]